MVDLFLLRSSGRLTLH